MRPGTYVDKHDDFYSGVVQPPRLAERCVEHWVFQESDLVLPNLQEFLTPWDICKHIAKRPCTKQN